jgi:hypothetical protein
MLDGTILVYDDKTLDKLWEVNVGAGFVAPPILCGERPAVHRHRLRHRPGRQGEDRAVAGTEVAGQRDDAVRVWVVSTGRRPDTGRFAARIREGRRSL